MFEYIASSKKGSGRIKNEDRVMVNDTVVSDGSISGMKENGFIAVVCDGVGGTGGGEIAAEMVASGFVGYEVEKASAYSLNHHLQRLNTSVMDAQKHLPGYNSMASTATASCFGRTDFCCSILEIQGYMKQRMNRFCLKQRIIQWEKRIWKNRKVFGKML